jgi:glutathione S-transferase
VKLYNSIGPNPRGLMNRKPFVWSDRLSMADIMLFGFVGFFARAAQPINRDLANIGRCYARMKAGPSASA